MITDPLQNSKQPEYESDPEHHYDHLVDPKSDELNDLGQYTLPGLPKDIRLQHNPILEQTYTLKHMLSAGPLTDTLIPIYQPFHFSLTNGGWGIGRNAGLEGFAFTEAKLREEHGIEALVHNLPHYFRYLDDFLQHFPSTHETRNKLRDLICKHQDPKDSYKEFIDTIQTFVEQKQEELLKVDRAQWVRDARIYQIFARAYNLEEKRESQGLPGKKSTGKFLDEFDASDFAELQKDNFDCVWPMGIFPIGQRDAHGTAGGSPYSIADHGAIDPQHGDLSKFVSEIKKAGGKVIVDLVPNHSALDAKWLEENPNLYVHRPADPQHPENPPEGYFLHHDKNRGPLWVRYGGYDSYGSRAYWRDTAQLDYSNPDLRRKVIDTVKDLIREHDVDGFRVDMAYQITNQYFARNWGDEMGFPLPQQEFMFELIAEVKNEFPAVAFIAEAYDSWDTLSAAGFDLIYGKNDIWRPGGHAGWYDSIESRQVHRITDTIERLEFLEWQTGGAGMLPFIGNHDEPSPERGFGNWREGAAALTLRQPGPLLWYGSQEIGYDDPHLDKDPKSLSFHHPAAINWKSRDLEKVLLYSALMNHEDENLKLRALRDPSHQWVGYALMARENDIEVPKELVLANPHGHEIKIDIKDKRTGVNYQGSLKPHSFHIEQL